MLSVASRIWPLVLLAIGLVWHSLQYNFVTDDAFISFVYSRNFAEHGELAFNAGMAPVEGYTNFLWTFVLGLLMVVGIPPEISSLVLGTGFAIATLVAVVRLSRLVWRGQSGWDYLAPALLVLSAGYACWSSGGLETQMFTFWVVLSIYLYMAAQVEPGRYKALGVVMALAVLTRPEGLLVAGAIGLHALVSKLIKRQLMPTRPELYAVVAFVVLVGGYFAWRWWYYGFPLPNTYYVKAAGPASPGYEDKMLANGLYYVGQWLRQTGLWLAAPLAILGLVAARPSSLRFRLATLVLPLAGLYLFYTVKVGGDFMGLHRFVMPLFVLAAIGVAFGMRLFADSVERVVLHPVSARVIAAGFVLLLLVGVGWSQLRLTKESLRFGNFKNDRGIDTPAFLEVYAHDRTLIGKHMQPCMRDDDFVIYGGAGAKPYYLETRGIDVFGLVSERIAHEVPRTNPRAGHNKWAPDKLLLEHEPSFVFSCYTLHRGPKPPSKSRLGACSLPSWRRRGYRPVTLHIPGLLERGEYYTFLVSDKRDFDCKGLVE